MATHKREWKESPVGQGEAERIKYVATIPASWGSSPFTNITCVLWEDPYGANTNVSTTKLTGDPSTSGATITSPTVYGLTRNVLYRLETQFDNAEGNTKEHWGEILGER